MPGPQYPQNPTFKPMVDAAYKLGSMLPPKKSAKAIDVNQYSGVSDAVQKDANKYTGGSGNSIFNQFSKLGNLTTPFKGSTNYEPGGTHKGVDIAAPQGTQIPAFTGGKVVESRTGQGWTPNKSSYGNTIVVQDSQGNFHRYSHLSQNWVKVGSTVQPGQILGTEGGTGSTYSQANPGTPGFHLDYRIYDLAKKYYDPNQYLEQYG